MKDLKKQKKRISADKLPEKLKPEPEERYLESYNKVFLFTFSNFKMKAVNIKGSFNNHFKSKEEYTRVLTIFLAKGLPFCSNESSNILSDITKGKNLHFHRIKGKDEVLRKIFKEYNFREQFIDELLEGDCLYQFEIPYLNGSPRVIFQKIENIISVLFIDTNHHIYSNKQKQKASHSFGYKYCPVEDFVK